MSAWAKRIVGFSARATDSMPSERSMPETSTPRAWRYAVVRPGPQPTSTTGPLPTSSANQVSRARCSGRRASSSANWAAYAVATAS